MTSDVKGKCVKNEQQKACETAPRPLCCLLASRTFFLFSPYFLCDFYDVTGSALKDLRRFRIEAISRDQREQS